MLKKFFNRFKKKSEESKVLESQEEAINKAEEIVDISDELEIEKEDESEIEDEEKEINITENVDNIEQIITPASYNLLYYPHYCAKLAENCQNPPPKQ